MSAIDCLWKPIDVIGCHIIGQSFVGGRSIEEVLLAGKRLKEKGYGVTYNLLGEHLTEQEKVDLTVKTLTSLIGAMDDSTRGNVSIKPTQCGLQISLALFRKNAEEIVDCGRIAGIETEFDAERLEFIPDTFKVFSEFASQFCYRYFVRQAVQAGLANIFELMDEYELWDKQLRVVQGSGVYTEKSGIFIKDFEQILERYQWIGARNYNEGQYPFLATVRNRRLIKNIRSALPRSAFGNPHTFQCEFQMLYGPLGRELGEELLAEGYPVRMYIPFVEAWCKDEWKSYGMRRSAMIRRMFFEDGEVRKAILREILAH